MGIIAKSHGLGGHRLTGQTGAVMSGCKLNFPMHFPGSLQVVLLPQSPAFNGFL